MNNKIKLQNEINEILDLISINTFLVPNNHSETHYFSKIQGSYKTYFNESRDYFQLEVIYNNENFKYLATKYGVAKNWKITIENNLLDKSFNSNSMRKLFLMFLENMKAELFSIDSKVSEERNIRKKIQEELKKIRESEEKITEYKQQLLDLKSI